MISFPTSLSGKSNDSNVLKHNFITSILLVAFWNFKHKVLKYPRNCRLHNTLITLSRKNPVSPKLYTQQFDKKFKLMAPNSIRASNTIKGQLSIKSFFPLILLYLKKSCLPTNHFSAFFFNYNWKNNKSAMCSPQKANVVLHLIT